MGKHSHASAYIVHNIFQTQRTKFTDGLFKHNFTCQSNDSQVVLGGTYDINDGFIWHYPCGRHAIPPLLKIITVSFLWFAPCSNHSTNNSLDRNCPSIELTYDITDDISGSVLKCWLNVQNNVCTIQCTWWAAKDLSGVGFRLVSNTPFPQLHVKPSLKPKVRSQQGGWQNCPPQKKVGIQRKSEDSNSNAKNRK